MAVFDVSNVSDQWLASSLMALIAPRPIALVATLSPENVLNLAPFSFFTICSVRPPVIMFSSLRRMRDGSVKDTEHNLLVKQECTVQIVTEELLYAQHIAAVDFPPEIDEFEKAGLTPIPSIRVRVPFVLEAALKFECKVIENIEFGKTGGSARVFFCEILLVHVDDKLLRENDSIDTAKIKHIGRQSGASYCRSYGDALFDLPIPKVSSVVGVSGVPQAVKSRLAHDSILIARLGATENIPSESQIYLFWQAIAEISIHGRSDILLGVPASLYSLVIAISNSTVSDPDHLKIAVCRALDLEAFNLAWYLALRPSSISMPL